MSPESQAQLPKLFTPYDDIALPFFLGPGNFCASDSLASRQWIRQATLHSGKKPTLLRRRAFAGKQL
jgi:hypothetical protein